MNTLAARAVYGHLLNKIDRELPGGQFSPEQIRKAVEAASRENGAIPFRSAAKAAKKKRAVFSRVGKRARKPRLSHRHFTGAVAKKR